MSYCRFSSDDFKSDVYVYLSGNGYVIHVATNKVIFKEPLPPKIPRQSFKREKIVSQIVSRSKRKAIELPHAGESFIFDTSLECADKLKELRDIGYVVPVGVIEALIEEATENN